MAKEKRSARGKKKTASMEEEVFLPVDDAVLMETGDPEDAAVENPLHELNVASTATNKSAKSKAEAAFNNLMTRLEKAATQEERDALIKAYEASYSDNKSIGSAGNDILTIMKLGTRRFFSDVISLKNPVINFLYYMVLLIFSPATFCRKGDEANFDWGGVHPPKEMCLFLIWPTLMIVFAVIACGGPLNLPFVIAAIPLVAAFFGWIYEKGIKELKGGTNG